MKRILSIILSILLIFAVSAGAFAADVEITETADGVIFIFGDWAYQPVGNYGYKINEYLGNAADAELPYSFAKQYVTSIGDYAFYANTSLNSVKLTEFVEKIDDYAFNGCSNLDTIAFYPSITSIGMGCFYGCSALTNVNLEDTAVTYVSDYCFADTGLTDVTLPDTCTAIGPYAFYNCASLSKIVIPASVTEIADNAFLNCSQLTICCYRDSAAHAYAVEKGIPYILIDDMDLEISFPSHSISLNGDIVINYYVALPDEYVTSGRAAVVFSWLVDGQKKTRTVTLTPDDKYDIGYKASCPVAVAEMTYDVTASVMIDGVLKCLPDNYSVRRYAKEILTDAGFAARYTAAENDRGNNGAERLAQLRTLVKTMLDYGTKAQIRFDRNTGKLANGGTDYFTSDETIPSRAGDMDAALSECGLEYVGTSVVYLSQTTLRHYYAIVDSSKFTAEIKSGVTFDGEAVDYGTRDDLIYFDKTDIAASKLDTEYVLSINGHDYQYSALDYSALSYSSDESPYDTSISKQLAAAVYRYNSAANVYFND
ncbi:MAG: leucine-rich repeat domain-containing protein [Ruminococcus sp.]|nr:leucine-rich repeat domain-containing protein [Ruminococcus sp.]